MTATGSEVDHFAEFCAKHLTQSVDEWDGLPLELEDWQRSMMGVALEYDQDGWPVWRSVVFCIPRKNGKTCLLAAYALYRLLTSDGSPEILLAASSDKQAGRLFDAAALFVRRNPVLRGLCRVRDHVGEIKREDGMGVIVRLSSDPARLHGYNPSLVVCDELAQWTTPTLKRAYAALTTGGGARKAPQVFTITTAGEAHDREDSILGRILDTAVAKGEVERSPGLTVAKLAASHMLVYNYEAPTSDPRDTAKMKLANPATWITEEFLAKQASNPELTAAQVLQLHGCVWAEGASSWFPAEVWAGCLDKTAVIPANAPVCVGVDVGLVHDSTAVAVAWCREDGKIVVEANVWTSARDTVGEFVHGGVVDLTVIEDHLRDLAQRYSVLEVAYDPRFFERSAQMLSEDGLIVVPVFQSSGPMADAYQAWYAAVMEGRVAHNGDPVLSTHVLSTSATKTDRGWKVSKIKQSARIDACVAAAMALYRAEFQTVGGGLVFA